MWGGVGIILPSTEVLMQAYTAWRVANNYTKQMADTVGRLNQSM